MEPHPEPVYPEQIIIQAIFIAGLLIGLAAIVWMLTRRSTTTRIRSSGVTAVIGWWGTVVVTWALSWFAGVPAMDLLDRLGFAPASAVFIAWMLALILLPSAALLATGIWMMARLRRPVT